MLFDFCFDGLDIFEPRRHLQFVNSVRDYLLQSLNGLLCVLSGCRLDCSLCRGIVDSHRVWLLFVRHDVVCAQVDVDVRSVIFVCRQSNAPLSASDCREIVTLDLDNFGDKLVSAIFRHFAVFQGRGKSIFKVLLSAQFDDVVIVLQAILEIDHLRWFCFRMLCYTSF